MIKSTNKSSIIFALEIGIWDIYIYIYIPNLGWWIDGSTSSYATTVLAVVCLSLLQVSESHFFTLSSLLSISHLGFLFFSFFGVLRIVVFSVLTSFYFLFLFFMNKKRIGSDLNWRLPPRRVHSNTWCAVVGNQK